KYWYQNLRHPVVLAPVIAGLARHSGAFIEVGPHQVLSPAIEETLQETGVERPVLGTLRRDMDGPTQFVTALAEAHCQGVHIDWERVLAAPGVDPRPVELPTYPFRGRRYWLPTPRALTDPTDLGILDAGHPLLGARVPVADAGRTIFTGRPRTGGHPSPVDHALGN